MAPAVEALDQVELPERPGEIEGRRHDLADQLAQLLDSAGSGQPRPPNVPAQIEALIVGPTRVGQLHHRRLPHPPPVSGYQVKARFNVVEQLGEGRRLALHDHRAPDVDVDRAALGEQR